MTTTITAIICSTEVTFTPWSQVDDRTAIKSLKRLVTFRKAFHGNEFLRKLAGLGN
jgi:hypothetical protein